MCLITPALVDYQVSAELGTSMNNVPVFASPSADGIRFNLGSKGYERAKFKFVSVSADFLKLFLHIYKPLCLTPDVQTQNTD